MVKVLNLVVLIVRGVVNVALGGVLSVVTSGLKFDAVFDVDFTDLVFFRVEFVVLVQLLFLKPPCSD